MSYYPRLIHLLFLLSEEASVETSAVTSEEAEIKDEESTGDTQVIVHRQLRASILFLILDLKFLYYKMGLLRSFWDWFFYAWDVFAVGEILQILLHSWSPATFFRFGEAM